MTQQKKTNRAQDDQILLAERVDDLTSLLSDAEMRAEQAEGEVAELSLELAEAGFQTLIIGFKTAILKNLVQAAGEYITKAEAEKAEAAEIANRLERTLSQPGLTDWAIKRRSINFEADGLSLIARVQPASRHVRTDQFFNYYGDPERTETVSTADTKVTVNLPFIGAVTSPGNITHTVTSYANTDRHRVTNKLTFELPIGDVTRKVTVTNVGVYYNGGEGWVLESTAIVSDQECDLCGGNHGVDKESTAIVS